ncbi:hypothetical protein GJ744_011295 [Endocarpon pusillum]|uniref:Tryprostatin B 6-hydroxylase n=1 Tax=Endocarpon pusillum TaxID=364733 RepID=A0A8H7ARI6_9EURO|nr:hypothetical protein GJ744_011295 [Endocarpon pusillum]
MYGVRYVHTFFVLYAFTVAAFMVSDGEPIRNALIQATSIAACFFGGLYSSLLVYRLFFHPLNKFSGPLGARVSSFWLSLQLRNADSHKKLLKLHEEHGDFVRVGSSDLSIVHPKAVEAIYGLGTKCIKGDWYDLTLPMVSLQTTRHKATHDRRRRLWSTAFSDKALKGYEERISRYQQRLIAQVSSFGGQPVNVTTWFNLYSFDVMGDLAFGSSFNMLETRSEHWAIKLLNEGVEPLSFMFPTWFFRMLVNIPGLATDWWRFIGYCWQKLDERMSTKVDIPDVMSALLAPWKDKRPEGGDLEILQGDSQLIVVAGSDTTAATLTTVMYELARRPDHISRLREEILPYVTKTGEIPHQRIQYLDHLNGVINETLRLHPPVPSSLQRKTPTEGIEIDGVYIPGNMTVFCPQYVIGRNEDVYQNARAFIPERWYSRPEMIKEKKAFAPFSTGSYGCIGRPLALLNVRTTIAKLIMEFDVSFAPGEDGMMLEANTRVHFTAGLGELNLVFKRRQP